MAKADDVFEVVHSRIGITGTNEALKGGEILTAKKISDHGIDIDSMVRIGAIKPYVAPVVEGVVSESDTISDLKATLQKANDSNVELTERVKQLEEENAKLKAVPASVPATANTQQRPR